MKNVIYKISFTGCDRVYIGQSVNIKNRIKYHKTELKRGTHGNLKLQRAYNKYGADSMRIVYLEDDVPFELLNERECYYIGVYNSHRKGLNNSDGGYLRSSRKLKKIYQYCKKTGILKGIYYGFNNAELYTGVGESNIRQCCYGQLKSAKGYHFSLLEKTPQMVLNNVKSSVQSEAYKANHRALFTGDKNPMYGVKRPELSGDKNPYAIMIKNGFQPKRKIDHEKVIAYYKSGKKQVEISKMMNCTQVQVSNILIKNGIRKFNKKSGEA